MSVNEDGTPLRIDQLPGRQALAGENPEPLLVRARSKATGEERWRVTKATAVLGRDGKPRLAVNVIEDVTEAKRAELSQRFLAEASRLLGSSLDHEVTLQQVAQAAVPQLADWCSVSVPDGEGFMRSVAVAHVDPAKVEFARAYIERYPTPMDAETGSPQVMRDGRSQLINEISDELLEQATSDPEQLELVRQIGMKAGLIVPLVGPTGAIGTLSFVSAESERTFSESDLALAEELGRRAGTAVENARLYTLRSHIAHTLQAGLMPSALPDVPGWSFATLYRPAGEENLAGGDFYDAFQTVSGWLVTMGDVTGRGAEAAALTAHVRHTLRTAAELLGDPLAALRHVNGALLGLPEQSLCTVAVVALGEDGVDVVCAGHPLPLLVRAGGDSAEAVGRGGHIAGAWPDGDWQIGHVPMQAGDLLVVYTDGVTDATAGRERFGDERLTAALRGATGPRDAIERVTAALTAFERGPQADDTALVVLQRTS